MKKKKAVITILGTVGGYCNRENKSKGIYAPKEKALYRSEIKEIEETYSMNSLPTLIGTYSEEYEIISIYTSCARDIQKEVLKSEGIEYDFDDVHQIKDDMAFDTVFEKIDSVISAYDKVIIDVSHGYRHLPILMIINAVMHNIESIEKIEKIIFAKEIEQFKEYKFVDLKRYLDLANISYALTTFERNYTVANNVKVSDTLLNDFLEELSSFSKHILANSMDELLLDTNKKKSVTTRLIHNINLLLESDEPLFKNLKRLLEKTLFHLKQIRDLKDEEGYKKLFYLSENMYKKGYLLNSITLLSEAIGLYSMEEIKKINTYIYEALEEYENNAKQAKNNENRFFDLYAIYNQSKAFYNNKENYIGHFLEIKKGGNSRDKVIQWNKKTKKLTNEIKREISNVAKKDIVNLSKKIDNIRNNLAHANSSQRLKDVEDNIKQVLSDYKRFCIDCDFSNKEVFKVNTSTTSGKKVKTSFPSIRIVKKAEAK